MSITRTDLERLIRAHQDPLYRYLRYLGAAPSQTEDLVQETFLATLGDNPNQPEHPEDPMWAAWLRGIARNLFLADCRRISSRPILMDDPELEHAEDVWATAFGESSVWTDHLAALEECMKTLPPRQREALDLRYRKLTARNDMAQQLNMTEQGIKTRLRRIRTALGRCIQQRLGTTRNA